MTARILVVDDQEGIRWLLSKLLEDAGYAVSTAADGQEALDAAAKQPPDLVLMDVRMPRLDGMTALERLRQNDPHLPVIMITAYGQVPDAVQAMKLGAADYLLKPFHNEKVLLAIRRVLERVALVAEIRGLRVQLESAAGLGEVMGTSQEIQQVFVQVQQVARTGFTVILQGETGTGKELVARAIHQQSDRRDRPFLAVDCGAVPEGLIESQLFGHERGAFTGADARRQGDFELASGGTLFLDEVSNLPVAIQAKLLRVLQERQIRRVGGRQFIGVDPRILAATNVDLQEEVRGGRFRQDLFHRLNEFIIVIPPLRGRRQDILVLARVFLEQARMELKKHIQGISEEAGKLLQEYVWPGNVRELKNVIRRAALLCAHTIDPEHLVALGQTASLPGSIPAFEESLEHGLSLKQITRQALAGVERQVVERALRLTRGNRRQAARLLGIDEKTLRTKVRGLGFRFRESPPDVGS
ncbi:MAG: sigma-54-dependent Fis family transcriptional regulator [candidate division NC10 bacterium]|nr:sigma-54-dependent Fis family transcriptional regulator [candidate division NC10 bacterium]